MVSHVDNAHEDSVNCICFLDNRLFATCSDDTSVALWDARYLKKKLKTMRGHSNWVKNIEYSAKDNYLVTSGFDGAIFAWDINKFNHDDGTEEASNIFQGQALYMDRGLVEVFWKSETSRDITKS